MCRGGRAQIGACLFTTQFCYVNGGVSLCPSFLLLTPWSNYVGICGRASENVMGSQEIGCIIYAA